MSGWTSAARAAALPLAVAAGIATLGELDGGYFATSWGWAAVVVLLASVALVLTGTLGLTRLEALFVGGLAALTAWTALSALWTESFSGTMAAVERGLVYPAALLAVLLAARRGGAPVLAGVLLGLTELVVHGLVNRLLPDVDRGLLIGPRLQGPITYANGFGLVATLGLLLALGFVLAARRATWAALAAATVVPFSVALYFTFSRGATLAFLVGLAAAVALATRRVQMLVAVVVLAPLPAVAIWLASRPAALALGVPNPQDIREGHRIAVLVVALTIAEAAVAYVLGRSLHRLAVSRRIERATVVGLAALALAAVVGAVALAGGPVTVMHRFDHGFASRDESGSDPRGRLLTIEGNHRGDFWRVALDDFEQHPAAGSGAGTYVIHWVQDRRAGIYVQNAHSLYLETLAELGVVGLVLLLAGLAAPLVAAVRRRPSPLAVAATGAFIAYLVNAGLDWDWQLPAVTLAGLACGAGVLLLDGEPRWIAPRASLRLALAAPLVALLAFSVVGLVGAASVARAGTAVAQGRWADVAGPAHRATEWTPWDSEAWRLLAEADLARGSPGDARAALRQALVRDPSNWRLWLRLSEIGAGSERAEAHARAHALNPFGVP